MKWTLEMTGKDVGRRKGMLTAVIETEGKAFWETGESR